MAVPWLQIVQLVPSIVDVSRELLKRTKTETGPVRAAPDGSVQQLGARIVALEENERRQAELVSQMAEQLAGMARAITALHRRVIWLTVGCSVSAAIAIAAVIVAAAPRG